jgi:hypothetical protein
MSKEIDYLKTQGLEEYQLIAEKTLPQFGWIGRRDLHL